MPKMAEFIDVTLSKQLVANLISFGNLTCLLAFMAYMYKCMP